MGVFFSLSVKKIIFPCVGLEQTPQTPNTPLFHRREFTKARFMAYAVLGDLESERPSVGFDGEHPLQHARQRLAE
jgi:hypothetical protein